MKQYRLSLLILPFILSPFALRAQRVEVLGVLPVGTSQEIVASVDLNGKSIQSVTSYAYDMTTGYNLTGTTYALVENQFLNVTVPAVTNASAYRIAVTFTDETTVLSPVFEPASGERFMWLGDYDWTSQVCGWDSHTSQIDQTLDLTKKFQICDAVYYKGVAGHAAGSITYSFADAPFASFQAHIGVMYDEVNGDARVRILTDDTEADNFVVYSQSNTGRGDGLLYKDVNVAMTDVSTLNFSFEIFDSNNWGDQVLMALARLYYPKQTVTAKQSQQVTMQTTGGLAEERVIALQATVSSNLPIYYRIAEGESFATLTGNVLTFNNGASGTVTVEACCYGDSIYAPANDFVTFTVDRRTSFLTSRAVPDESGTSNYGYLFVDAQTTPYETLYVQYYNNVLQLTPSKQVDVMPYVSDPTFSTPQVIEFPVTEPTTMLRLWGHLKGETDDVGVTDYYENGTPLVYMSDLTTTETYSYKPSVRDICFDGTSTLNLGGQTYAKGFGMHATSTQATTFGKTDFARCVGEGGKQNGKTGNIAVNLYFNGNCVHSSGNLASGTKTAWDYQLADTVTSVKIEVGEGGDGNGQDWGSIGAPRLYRRIQAKTPQTLTWAAEHALYRTEAFTDTLDATASSGLPISYKLVKGEKYATIEGNLLHVTTLPDRDTIVVEAFQPGNHYYAPASPIRATYQVLRGYVVNKGERLEIKDNCTVEEIVVYGDATGAGEVVTTGVVNVKRFVYKYTFVPTAWNFFSFPVDANLDQISNFNALGYTFNGGSSKPTYYVCEYSTENRATSDEHSGWTYVSSPEIQGGKGYLLGINARNGAEPREVTFTIDNAQLTFDGGIKQVDLTLDLTTAEPGAKIPVYISSSNTKSNTLKVEVDFEPADASVLPLNYERALQTTRVVGIPGGNGVRLTLPTQEKARVYILDKKMKRVLKAVHYTAPLVIDMTDLASGTYPMVVEFGNARRLMEVTKQ